MKQLFIALSIVFSIIATEAFATEYRTIEIPYSGNGFDEEVPLVIPEGQTVSFVSYYVEEVQNTQLPYSALSISYGDNEKKIYIEKDDGKTYEGPVTIWSRVTTMEDSRYTYNGTAFFIYKIVNSFDVDLKPMNIISLPEDNNGDMNLVVETSTDLQTWTPVYSGSAGTSGTAAFFRTRLISQ